jgi:aspartyl-tRNA(Asn)/glutamyl-tRNA(Gln) amidotransferase subunit A
LDLGIITPQSAYHSAQELRASASLAVDVFLRGGDAALLPTAGSAAPARDTTGDNSLQIPWTLCGTPAISLPMGLDPDGMPLGIQLITPTGADHQLLAIARWCETMLEPLPPPLETGRPGA